MTLKDSSSDKVTEAPQPRVAFQDFEKQLASVTLLVEGTLKDKEKENPLEALVFVFRIMKIVVISSFVLKDQFC